MSDPKCARILVEAAERGFFALRGLTDEAVRFRYAGRVPGAPALNRANARPDRGATGTGPDPARPRDPIGKAVVGVVLPSGPASSVFFRLN